MISFGEEIRGRTEPEEPRVRERGDTQTHRKNVRRDTKKDRKKKRRVTVSVCGSGKTRKHERPLREA